MKKANETIEGNLTTKGKSLLLKKGNLFVLKDKEGNEFTYAVGGREEMTFLVKSIKDMLKYFTSRNAKIMEGNRHLDENF